MLAFFHRILNRIHIGEKLRALCFVVEQVGVRHETRQAFRFLSEGVGVVFVVLVEPSLEIDRVDVNDLVVELVSASDVFVDFPLGR